MIVISDLTASYVQEVSAVEMSTVVGGGYKKIVKVAEVDFTQFNLLTIKSSNKAVIEISQ